jgi:hypothetical protein
VVVGVLLAELLEEEAIPNFQVLRRRVLLQLVDIALFEVDVEGIEVVAGDFRIFEPFFDCCPDAAGFGEEFTLLLFYASGGEKEVAEFVRVDVLGDEDKVGLTELKTERVDAC